MTYVKQRLGQGEAPDTGSGRSRRGPGHLAGHAKDTPLTAQPPVPAEDTWLWVGGWVPGLCLPPGAGAAWPCEDGERKADEVIH